MGQYALSPQAFQQYDAIKRRETRGSIGALYNYNINDINKGDG